MLSRYGSGFPSAPVFQYASLRVTCSLSPDAKLTKRKGPVSTGLSLSQSSPWSSAAFFDTIAVVPPPFDDASLNELRTAALGRVRFTWTVIGSMAVAGSLSSIADRRFRAKLFGFWIIR